MRDERCGIRSDSHKYDCAPGALLITVWWRLVKNSRRRRRCEAIVVAVRVTIETSRYGPVQMM
jgi:hypothetical protein